MQRSAFLLTFFFTELMLLDPCASRDEVRSGACYAVAGLP